MNDLLCVLPVISEHTTDICVESLLQEDSSAAIRPDEILIVDNSKDGFADRYGLRTYRDSDGHNLGVARSWNVGAREVLEKEIDYLVILSASMNFGPILHTTWRFEMLKEWGKMVIEAQGHSWHLIAFHRRVFELIGLFDENFYPAYVEGIDFAYRLRMFGLEGGWPKPWVNALSQGSALHNHVVNCPGAPMLKVYSDKWGGHKGAELYLTPFGNKPIDYWEENSIPDLAEKYQLGEEGKDWW